MFKKSVLQRVFHIFRYFYAFCMGDLEQMSISPNIPSTQAATERINDLVMSVNQFFSIKTPDSSKNEFIKSIVLEKILNIQEKKEPVEKWNIVLKQFERMFPFWTIRDFSFIQHPSVSVMLENNENIAYYISLSLLCDSFTIFEERKVPQTKDGLSYDIYIIGDIPKSLDLIRDVIREVYPDKRFIRYSTLKNTILDNVLPYDLDREEESYNHSLYRLLYGTLDLKLNAVYNPVTMISNP